MTMTIPATMSVTVSIVYDSAIQAVAIVTFTDIYMTVITMTMTMTMTMTVPMTMPMTMTITMTMQLTMPMITTWTLIMVMVTIAMMTTHYCYRYWSIWRSISRLSDIDIANPLLKYQ